MPVNGQLVKVFIRMSLSLEERLNLCLAVGEEVIQESELRALLASKKPLIRAYDGFEPSKWRPPFGSARAHTHT